MSSRQAGWDVRKAPTSLPGAYVAFIGYICILEIIYEIVSTIVSS